MSATAPLSDAKRLLLERRLRGEGARPRAPAHPVLPRLPGAPVPVTPEQGIVWLHAGKAPSVPLYNETITVHRRGCCDVDALRRAFAEVVHRHESWRTSFEAVDGEVMQVVHPELLVELPFTDLSAFPLEEAEHEAERIATGDARTPIATNQAPLFRARIVKLADAYHRLHVVVHHIIFDGVTCYRVLMPELAALYDAYAAGCPPTLPPPALQYGDYAVWRRRATAEPEFAIQVAQQMAHWRLALAGELPALQLPFDRPRPPTVTHRGAVEQFTVPASLTDAMRALATAERATPYMVLLAAFKAVLFRYAGQGDMVVGGVTDVRRRPELERVSGYFLNPIALRTRPAASLPFREFLRQVRETVLGALGASEVPFDQVVRELGVRRDPAAHPVFTVFFSIQPPVELLDPAWDLTQTDTFSGGAKFDIYFEMEDRPGGMLARFMYNADLFDPDTIRRMAGHYLTLLEGAIAEPGQALATLPLLTGDELRDARDAWHPSPRPVPRTTLYGLFEEQARRSPEARAVSFEGRSWSYAELDQRAGEIAGRLRAEGAAPGRLVGLHARPSLDAVAGLFGILRSGAAYLPLNPALPRARRDTMAGEAAPVLLLTDRDLAPDAPAGIPLMMLGEPGGGGPDGPAAGPDNLAYVIYTSGSTGRPKGVEVSHRAVVAEVSAMTEMVGCSACDTVLAVTTFSFDPSVLDLFMPLSCGGTVVLAGSETAFDPVLLAEAVRESGCTILQATPTTWRRLIEAGWAGTPDLKALCGGEAMPRSLADALLSKGVRLWNVYGPTETTIWATAHEVRRDVGPVPIGQPISNYATAVLDEQGNSVPAGIAGELLIGGTGVARGYLDHEELTRERFVIHEGRRAYRTGDIVRHRNGTLEFLGRRDNQVKVRGFRVELEEVEGAMAAHPRVAGATARAVLDRSGENGLAGYLVGRGGPPPDPVAMRAFLRGMLPDHMVPSVFVTLDAFPLTSTGKVDRASLPDPTPAGSPAGSEEPRDEWERRVARIWGDVLGVAEVGRNDDFFDLGGHSILVAKLQGRVAAEFNQTLPLAALFEAQTVSRMACLLRRRSGALSKRPARLLRIQPAGSRPPMYWIEPTPSFRLVADALGRDQPVLGLSFDEADLAALGETPTLEAMAACLVRTLIEVDPAGPYRLGGICNKGVLAFEMASQLAAAGRAVASLIIVDGVNPVNDRRIGSLALEWSKARFHVAAAWRLSGRAGLRYLSRRIMHLVVPLKAALHWQLPIDKLLSGAVGRYVPTPYASGVILLQVKERPDRVSIVPGWRDVVTGPLTVCDVPGTHETMQEPRNAPGLAAVISNLLALGAD